MRAVVKSIPFREYAAHPAENNSGLKYMAKSAKEYRHRKAHGREDTQALSIGRHVHTCVLEPDLFDSTMSVWRGAKTDKGAWSTHKGTKAYKQHVRESEEAGLTVIDAGEAAMCYQIRDAVYSNQDARELIENAHAELSVFWRHRFGIACKMRADILRKNADPYLADLKTCIDASPDGFARAAAKFEYHVQLGMYQAGVKALVGENVPVYIIAAEKAAPYDVAVYEVPQAALDVGRSIFEDRLAKVAKCHETGLWPGVQEGVGTLELPNWVFEEDAGELVWEGVA